MNEERRAKFLAGDEILVWLDLYYLEEASCMENKIEEVQSTVQSTVQRTRKWTRPVGARVDNFKMW